MTQLVAEKSKSDNKSSDPQLPEASPTAQFSQMREVKKSKDFNPNEYEQNFKDLVKHTINKYQYGENFVRDNVKGDKGFETHCAKELDNLIHALTRKSPNSTISEHQKIEEARVFTHLYNIRESIQAIPANSDLTLIRKAMFDRLIEHCNDTKTINSIENLDKKLKYLTIAAFLSRGENEAAEVQKSYKTLLEKAKTFSNEDITKYLSGIENEVKKEREQEQYKLSDWIAGSALKEYQDLPSWLGTLYFAKHLFTLNEVEKDIYSADFVSSKNGSKWKLGITLFSMENGIIYLQNKETAAFASLQTTDFAELCLISEKSRKGLKKEEAQQKGRENLEKFLENVEKEYQQENNKEYRKLLIEKDLTQKHTSFLTIYPKEYDQIISGAITGSLLKEVSLGKKYNFNETQNNHIFSDNPIKDLEKSLDNILKNSPQTKNVFIDLNNHGSIDEIEFKTPVTAEDLEKLLSQDKYKNIEFFISSIACFGGGLKEGFSEIKSKNINVFLQTTDSVPNIVTSLDKSPETTTPRFKIKLNNIELSPLSLDKYHPPVADILFIKNIINPEVKTTGEAFDKADKEVRNYFLLNPQAVLTGGIVQTAGEEVGSNKVSPADYKTEE